MEENLDLQLQPQPPERGIPKFPWERRERLFATGIFLAGLLLVNCCLFGGYNLGFAVGAIACVVLTVAYLLSCGKKPGGYCVALLVLSVVIAAGFARSDDGFVKFVMVCFLFFSVNLSFALLAGRNRRNPGAFSSLLDAPGVFFGLGFGCLGEAVGGLHHGLKNGGGASKKTGAILLGLLLAAPLLVVVIVLLISADAAFAGLMDKLPDFRFGELIATLLLGGGTGCVFYARGTALYHAPCKKAEKVQKKGIHPLTIHTVLIGVCVVYLVYLLSQLAYFVGGFAGILPEGFTMAEYARRGFFEMAWLCAINLSVIALAIALVEKGEKAPLLTRLLCLFIGLVTLFFVVTASAKMGMYIGEYGLTRLRVLTEVIMVFLGAATLLVCIWLFVPKLPYMKAVLLCALVIGAVVLWVDVDTVVAAYNVTAYQSGALQSVDVEYLATLSSGAVPYIAQLAENGHPDAVFFLENAAWEQEAWIDWLRGWNWAEWIAQQVLQAWRS